MDKAENLDNSVSGILVVYLEIAGTLKQPLG